MGSLVTFEVYEEEEALVDDTLPVADRLEDPSANCLMLSLASLEEPVVFFCLRLGLLLYLLHDAWPNAEGGGGTITSPMRVDDWNS
jgi:hypothetical protein